MNAGMDYSFECSRLARQIFIKANFPTPVFLDINHRQIHQLSQPCLVVLVRKAVRSVLSLRSFALSPQYGVVWRAMLSSVWR